MIDMRGASSYKGMKLDALPDAELLADATCPVCGEPKSYHPPYDRESMAFSWMTPAVLDYLESEGLIFVNPGKGTAATYNQAYFARVALLFPDTPFDSLHLHTDHIGTFLGLRQEAMWWSGDMRKRARPRATTIINRMRAKHSQMPQDFKDNYNKWVASGQDPDLWFNNHIDTLIDRMCTSLWLMKVTPLNKKSRERTEYHPCYMKIPSGPPIQSVRSEM